MTPRGAWLFSMTRSGSSAVAYASAHALGWAVADEPFGPWDRTGEPYLYPREQITLHRQHLNNTERLMPATNAMFERVITAIAERAGAPGVIVKMPHLMVHPDDIAAFRPHDRTAYLIRNPLARLNSLHTRGWHHAITPPHDLEVVKSFLNRYLRAPAPQRARFDRFTSAPRRFFRSLWDAWEIPYDESQVEAAVHYRATHYHESSATLQTGRNPHRVLSEHRRAVPIEACEAYLNDRVIRAAFTHHRWDTDPSLYAATP